MDAKVLTDCKKLRASLRGNITGILNDANKFIKAFEDSEDDLPAKRDVSLMSTRLDRLDAELNKQNEKILELLPESEVDAEIASRAKYFDSICEAKVLIKELDAKLKVKIDESEIPEQPLSSDGLARLPKYQIEKFSGSRLEYRSFIQQFKETVDKNKSISTVTKFFYLKNNLQGQALEIIKPLLGRVTEATYKVALDLLEERFGVENIEVDEHIAVLHNIRPVKDGRNIKELRKLLDLVNLHVKSLESVGVSTNLYAVSFFPVLLRCIPEELALEFVKNYEKPDHLSNENNNAGSSVSSTESRLQNDKAHELDTLLKFLNKTAISCERYNLACLLGNDQKLVAHQANNARNFRKKEKYQKDIPAKRTTTYNASVSRPDVSNVPKVLCIFCNENHESKHCTARLSYDERREKLRAANGCFRCFRRNHTISRCRDLSAKCSLCNGKHYTFMHYEKPTAGIIATSSLVNQGFASSCDTDIFLQTASANICGKAGEQTVRVLLDSGAQRSFIRREVSESLAMPICGYESIEIHSFGKDEPIISKTKRVKVVINSLDNAEEVKVIEPLEIDNIGCSLGSIPSNSVMQEVKAKHLVLADIYFSGNAGPAIDLVIGADYYNEFVTTDKVHINGSLYASRTFFGWTLIGPGKSSLSNAPARVNSMCASITKDLDCLWRLDNIGINDSASVNRSPMNHEVYEFFENTVNNVGDRYEVRMPVTERVEKLANNKKNATRILNALLRRLEKDPKKHEEYNKAMQAYFDAGHAEKVPANEQLTGPVYYTPHHGVFRQDKTTTKLRIVFNCSSSKVGNLSLNDCLDPGPNLNPDLVQLLIRFRSHPIAVVADVEKAFLQILLHPDDRNLVRFLWQKDGEPIQEYRMNRVLFGASSSPFLLSATIRHHVNKFEVEFPGTTNLLQQDFYVDDFVSGVETPEEAQKIMAEATHIMSKAGMKLHKWRGNACDVFDNDLNESDSSQLFKVLGIHWNSIDDTLSFVFDTILASLPIKNPTKRKILQLSARIYDPLGFLAPVLVVVKLLLQQLWASKIRWDQELDDSDRNVFAQWCNELKGLESIVLQRWFGTSITQAKDVQLHIFCDASPKAYSAVAYVRVIQSDESALTFLVGSKNRVAPMKELTLPRLELMAAVIGARFLTFLRQALPSLPFSKIYMWTDSTIAFYWIQGEANRWKPFVQNRVREIQSLTNSAVWNHCPGSDNPADLSTRGISAGTLVKCSLWWSGPVWLRDDVSSWPINLNMAVNEDSEELLVEQQRVTVQAASVAPADDILRIKYHSNYWRLVRSTAFVLYALKRFQGKKIDDVIDAKNVRAAECALVKQVQMERFSTEIACVQGLKQLPKNSVLRNFRLLIDENGLLRISSRLAFGSDLSENEKFPIVLPGDHHYTELLITKEHKRLLHAGTSIILSHLREQYWVIRGRQTVKRVIRQCLSCRRLTAKSASQVTGPLPSDRITESPPFSVIGVDFCGPFYVYPSAKVYVALFTCAVTRAIHLEVVPNLSAPQFLLAFRRFIGRRGIPASVYSDNAKTFIKANVELNKLWKATKSEEAQTFYAAHGIEWKFIAPKAPWWGGMYERLVRSVKDALKKTLGRALTSREEFQTILTEAEAIINSRPLTHAGNNIQDPESLTPAHFLLGKGRVTSLPNKGDHAITTTDIDSASLRGKYRRREILIKSFWKRWKHEYLLQLRNAMHSRYPADARDLRVGEVVLINDDNKPRVQWHMAVITETHPGRDGRIRSLTLRLPSGSLIKRPAQLLYPLEIFSQN